MIRLIIKQMAALYDGKTEETYKTIDINLPEVEKFLNEHIGYAQCGSRQIIGSEIIDERAK